MSKVVSMSTGAIDPIAQSKRVFFRPTTESNTIRVGDAVCYNSDIAGDHKERGVGSNPPSDHIGGAGTAYAEGVQTYTGRLFIVEQPKAANFMFFAGIVKCLGPKAGADGDMIEIFVPNGAVVPVYTDADCTFNQTLLALKDATYMPTTAGWGRPIGIAMETIDRSTDNGLVWAKIDPNMFMYSGSDDLALLIGTDEGSCGMLHHAYVESYQTAGSLCMLDFQGELKGAGDIGSGLIKVRAKASAALSGNIKGISVGLTLATGFVEGATFNAAVHAAIGSSGTPDLTTLYISALLAEYFIDESASVGGVPSMVSVITVHAGTYNFDYLLHIYNAGDCGDATVANATTQEAATDKYIPVMIGPDSPANVYHLRAYKTAQ